MNQQNSNHGRDQNIINQPGIVNIQGERRLDRPRNQQILLQNVKGDVEKLLSQALLNADLINLSKQAQPEKVRRSQNIKIFSPPSEPLPPDGSILEVFKQSDIKGKLLLLGEPGSGKTITMLDLAQRLIQEAEADVNYPIPVLFNLSSWTNPHQPIKDWLVKELELNYNWGKDIGKKWLEDKQLLPLLDGLDEVKLKHQASCVRAINRWMKSESGAQYLVVCSRREEYEKVVLGHWEAETQEEEADNPQKETRLNLNGAILLKPLTDEQIHQYLASINFVELWQVLQRKGAVNNTNTSMREPNFLELIRTPLFLYIVAFILRNNDKNHSEVRPNLLAINTQRQQLFDAYCDVAMKRILVTPEQEEEGIESRTYGKRKPPNENQTRKWLVYLAQQLQRESQTEFLIEKMQPYWLKTGKQKNLYSLYSLSIALIVGLIVGISYVILGIIYGQIFGWIFGLIIGLIFVGLIYGLKDELEQIILIETFTWSFRNVKEYVFINLSKGLIIGLSDLLIIPLIFGLIIGLISGHVLASGLGSVLGNVLLKGLITSEVNIKTRPNQGISKAAKNSFILILISGVIGMLIHLSIAYLGYGMSLGLLLGLRIGLVSVIQHITLRLTIYQTGSIPWNYARFLDYCTERNLLQRVGGRYRFIHKLLQDHFAEMVIDTTVNRE